MKVLTQNDLADLKANFEDNPSNRLMQNAVAQSDVNEIALDRSITNEMTHPVSNVLDHWAPTNQKMSGRCWLFAGLNQFRVNTMEIMNTKQFEFSQNYLMFWDKIERANYLLEAIIETADRPVDDRTVAWLLDRPLADAGQWDMFVNLVKKYGVVPKTVMPETESSMNTARMNSILYYHLRQAAACLRDLHPELSVQSGSQEAPRALRKRGRVR